MKSDENLPLGGTENSSDLKKIVSNWYSGPKATKFEWKIGSGVLARLNR